MIQNDIWASCHLSTQLKPNDANRSHETTGVTWRIGFNMPHNWTLMIYIIHLVTQCQPKKSKLTMTRKAPILLLARTHAHWKPARTQLSRPWWKNGAYMCCFIAVRVLSLWCNGGKRLKTWYMNLPISQCCSSNGMTHAHMYPRTPSVHVAPFCHGPESQSSIVSEMCQKVL
jgi:hypothetical protein